MSTILFISAFTIIIPVIFGSILYKKLDKTMKLFYLFLALNLFVDIIAMISTYMFKYNLIVYNISQFFNVTLAVFLFHSFQDIKLKNLNVVYLIPVFILIWTIFYSTGIDSIYTYSSNSILISSFLILIFAFTYILKLSYNMYKSHLFWLLSGIICLQLLMSIPDFLFLFISIYEIVNMQIIVIINNVISVLCFTLAFYFYNNHINQTSKNNYI